MGKPIKKIWLGPNTGQQIVVDCVKFSDNAVFYNAYIIQQVGDYSYIIRDSGNTHAPEVVSLANATIASQLSPNQCYILTTPYSKLSVPCKKITQFRLYTYNADTTIGTYLWSDNNVNASGETLLVGKTYSISGIPITTGFTNYSYSFKVQATGGSGPYTYSVTSGSLPVGVTLNSTTGLVSGTPTTASTYSGIIISATDSTSTVVSLPSFSVVISLGLPKNTVLPVVSGSYIQGYPLSVTTGTWSNSPTYTYQWKRNYGPITGQTSTTYTTTLDDINSYISCDVIATNATGSTTVSSNAFGTIVQDLSYPRYGTGPANSYLPGTIASFIAGMTQIPGTIYNSRVTPPFTLSPAVNQYGWVVLQASDCITTSPVPAGYYGATFTDSFGAGGWQGAGLAANNLGASPSISYSNITYTDSTGLYVLFRQDFSNAPFTGPIT